MRTSTCARISSNVTFCGAVIGLWMAAGASRAEEMSADRPVTAKLEPASSAVNRRLQDRDREDARLVCRAAVQRLRGDPATGPTAPDASRVHEVSEGVMSVEVRVNLAGSKTAAAVYLCQATNQNGSWEAEAVSKVKS